MTDDTILTTVEVDEAPWRELKAESVREGITIGERLSEVLNEYYETTEPSELEQVMGASDGPDECPECGAGLVHEMGSEAKRCPNCGWSE